MKLQILRGSTSIRVMVFVSDSSSSTGAGLTGLTSASGGLKWYYWRGDTGNSGGVSVTLAAGTRGTWTSGGIVEIDATNMPGWYELGVPNAALVTGSKSVVMHLMGATNMAPLPLEVQLVAFDPENANSLGLGYLDAAMTSRLAAAGYTVPPTVGQIRTEMDANSTKLANVDVAISTRLASASISLSSGKVTVGTNDDKTGYSLSAAAITAIWEIATSTLTNAGTMGKRLLDCLTGDAFARIGTNGAGLTAIGPVTLATSQPNYAPAKAGDAMTLTEQERVDTANEIERQIIDEGDAEKVIDAFVQKIEEADLNLGDISVDAIAEAVRTNLAPELARIDVDISSRASDSDLTAAAGNIVTILGYTGDLAADWANDGRLDLILDTRASQSSLNLVPLNVWNYDGPMESYRAGWQLNSMFDWINTMQGDWADNGRLDNILDSRSSQTSVNNVLTKTNNLPNQPAAVGSAMTLTSAYDLYSAAIDFRRDDGSSRDEYTVTWSKNGVPLASGITVPKITVIDREGANLISEIAMSAIGSTGSLKYDSDSDERVTDGDSVIVRVSATIDGGPRTFEKLVGRDSVSV